jgi:hypothetical protein
VLRLWECQLRDNPKSCLKRLIAVLRIEGMSAEPNS